MLDVTIVTPEGITYQSTVKQITIPTTSGQITVLTNHIPLVSVLKAGELVIQKEGGESVALAVSGGILEVQPDNKIYVMADTAERAEHIDIARAEAARARAEELLKQKDNMADVDFARIQASLEKELARLHVGKKYRNIRTDI